jgi:hypothetical protein
MNKKTLATRDEMQAEAIARMELLHLSSDVILDFDSYMPVVHLSKEEITGNSADCHNTHVVTDSGISYQDSLWSLTDSALDNDSYEDLMKLQKEQNIIIYHCNVSGSFLSALYVSSNKGEWEHDRECIGKEFVRVYCRIDFTKGAFEVGDVFFTNIGGLLFRTE